MFWALLRLILALLRLILNESKSGPKHIYAREHKLYCYIIHLQSEANPTIIRSYPSADKDRPWPHP